jgi:hypothetical protein
MKRILLSIATGLMLVTDYIIAAAAVFFLSGENKKLLPYLNFPTGLPKALYSYFFRPTAELTQTLFVSFFLANTLLYAFPVYVVLTLLSRPKQEQK